MDEIDETSALLSNVPRQLSKMTKFAYSSGHILNDICAAVWFSYTLLFFQVVLVMPPIMAGSLLLIGQIADALATPIVGIYADRSGSRKVWHLLGSAVVIFSFPLIFSPCPGCQDLTPAQVPDNFSNSTGSWAFLSTEDLWLRGIYYAVLVIVFQGGWAIVQISHLALIPDLTPSQNERVALTAYRYAASVSASIFVYLLTWLIFHVTSHQVRTAVGPGDSYKFRDIILIGVLVGSTFTVWFQCGLKPPPITGCLSSSITQQKQTISTPYLFKVSILYVASRLFLTLSLVYMPLYLAESLREQAETLATVPLVSYVASFLSGLSVKHLSSCISSKWLYLFGAIFSIVASMWVRIGFNSFSKDLELYTVAAFMGIGSSVTIISSLCLTADMIGKNNESGAFVYSVVTFADKLLNGIVVILIESLKCDNFWDCPHYYRDVMAYACGGTAVIGLGALFVLWKKLKTNKNI